MKKIMAIVFGAAAVALSATGYAMTADSNDTAGVTTTTEHETPSTGCKSATVKRNAYAALGIDALGESEVARREGQTQWLLELLKTGRIVRVRATEAVCVTSADRETAQLLVKGRAMYIRRGDLTLHY